MPSDDVGSRDSLIAPFVRSLALTRRGALWQALAGAGLATAGGLLLPAGAAFAQAADGESKVPDWDVPGGHFYTQTAPPDAPQPPRSAWNDPAARLRHPLPVGPDSWRTSTWPR